MHIEEFIMSFLRDMGFTISQSAVVVMLETGITTQETKFDAYLMAKNLVEVFQFPEERQEFILTRSLLDKYKDNALAAWAKHKPLMSQVKIEEVNYYQKHINRWMYNKV